jgi:hypothetical protein
LPGKFERCPLDLRFIINLSGVSLWISGLPVEFRTCPFVSRVTDEILKSWSTFPNLPVEFRVFPLNLRDARQFSESSNFSHRCPTHSRVSIQLLPFPFSSSMFSMGLSTFPLAVPNLPGFSCLSFPGTPFRNRLKGRIFFHQVLDIFFLMEYFLIFREKSEMFKWKATESAGRNGAIKIVKTFWAEAYL